VERFAAPDRVNAVMSGGDVGENLARAAQQDELVMGKGPEIPQVVTRGMERDEPGLPIAQKRTEHGIPDPRQRDGVDAQPEREGEDRDGGKAGGFGEGAEGEAHGNEECRMPSAE
jgi:hypothetical protein